MLHEKILSRKFNWYEQMKLGCGASIGCFVATFMVFNIFKLYLCPNFIFPSVPTEIVKSIPGNLTTSISEVYELNGDVRIHGNSSTIFVYSNQKDDAVDNISWTTRPYARREDEVVMNRVRKFTIINQSPLPENKTQKCSRNFSEIPAILFSTGGYAGNQFHDFSDVLVPLYLTSRRFNGSVIFLISHRHYWWNYKFKSILRNLSKHEPIDIDKVDRVLCFSRMIVGLRSQKELGIDPKESPHYSMKDFRQFLRSAYLLQRDHVVRNSSHRPRLLIISREKTRRLTNENNVVDVARGLGFDVTVEEIGWNMSYVAGFVNSFDVMMGVHGAGLTNMVFLPEKAVLIQIVPFGVDHLAKAYYEEPAKGMGLRYLEYKASLNESSLSGKYPVESEIYRDPLAVYYKGWRRYRSIYLDDQDVNITDLDRLRTTLVKASELVCA